MENPRKYGRSPYLAALVHGGPGAAGELAPVTRVLSRSFGVLEPLQTAVSLEGQIEELSSQLAQSANAPLTLVGYSWGAWLVLLAAARYPSLASKIVLVSSGPFEASFAERILPARLSRLPAGERDELSALLDSFNAGKGTDCGLARVGALCGKADAFSPLPHDPEPNPLPCRADIFGKVWTEAAELRRSGRLLEMVSRVACPVAAIHGEHDPHPAEGVRGPLSRVLRDFRFMLLPRCGHTPWYERDASALFYERLSEEISPLPGK